MSIWVVKETPAVPLCPPSSLNSNECVPATILQLNQYSTSCHQDRVSLRPAKVPETLLVAMWAANSFG